MTTPHADPLLAKIKAHDALAGIIGMGYVGLPPVILSMSTAR
jgi:UDP-N-acetyl-D-mannosaminuronate dehydrogenase